MKMRKLISICLFLSLFCGGAAAQKGVVLRSIDGNTYDVGELIKKDQVTIVSFFATWCKPCLRELGAINDVYDDWKESVDVQFIAVSIDTAQDSEKVAPLANGNAWDFLVLLDPEGELKRQMQVQTVPHTVIFDKRGKAVDTHNSYTDGDENAIFEMIKKL